LKFRSVAVEQVANIVPQGLFRPRDELAPVVLGLLPEDFDHIEFGTVGREVAQEDFVLSHPAPSDVVVQTMMDFGVIENNEGRSCRGDLAQKAIDKRDECFPIDRAGDLLVVKLLTGEVKSPHNRDTLMMCRRHRMRLTDRRPRTLYRGRGRESRLIVVEQLTLTLAGQVFETGKFRLAGGKSYGVPVFFRLNRVRLKLNPLALSRTLKMSREHGSGQ